ncbi:MAG: ester cyclase [Acidimicrobiia bacterium]
MSDQTEDNKEIVRRYQEAYNTGELDALDELLAPDWVSNSFPVSVMDQTVENLKVIQGMLLEAVPDLRYETELLIAEGDHVVQVWTARGTHKGEMIGLVPRGNQIELGGTSVFEIRDGRIVRHHAVQDVIDFIDQCGGDVPAEWMAFVHRAH